MSKDDDSLDDVNALMKMIGGAKKKETLPPAEAKPVIKEVPPPPSGPRVLSRRRGLLRPDEKTGYGE